MFGKGNFVRLTNLIIHVILVLISEKNAEAYDQANDNDKYKQWQ